MINTLRNKLKSIKVGSGLQSTTDEELQALSNSTGRTSPPTSPLEAGVVGANVHQAKMAGTGAQKGVALRQAIQGSNDLASQQRTEQTRTNASAEEQNKLARGEQVKQLGGLQDRVKALTSNILSQAGTAQLASQLSLSEQALAAITPDKEPAVRQALAALQTNPNDQQAILALNQALGKMTVEEMLPANELKSFFLGTTEATGQQVAENLQDNISVSELDLPSLGFSTPDELANLLGVDPVQLQGMTVKQLKQDIEGQIQEEFTTIQDLERKATDPSLGAAERAEARKQLREMGAIGVRKLESDVDNLADQIANADTVEFDGEEIAISDLLEDEYITGLTAKYLDPNADPEWKKTFKQQNPELAKWIDDNAAALEDAVKDVDEGIKQFAEIQQKNMQLAEPATGQAALPKELMQKIIPGFGNLSAEQISVESIPILKAMKSEQNPQESANAYNALKTLYQYDPDLVSELAGMDEGTLRSLGVLQNTPKWQTYTRYLEDYNRVKNMDPTNEDSVWAAIFGRPIAGKDAHKAVDEAFVRQKSGLFGDSPIKSLSSILADRRGNAANTSEVALRLQQNMLGADGKPLSLSGYASGQQPITTLSDKLAGINNYLSQPDKSGLYQTVRGAFFNDDKIDGKEAAKFASHLPAKTLQSLFTTMDNKLTKDSKAVIEKEYRKTVFDEWDQKIKTKARMSMSEAWGSADRIKRDDAGQPTNWSQTTFDRLNAIRKGLKEFYAEAKGPLEKLVLKGYLNRAEQEYKAYGQIGGVIELPFQDKSTKKENTSITVPADKAPI